MKNIMPGYFYIFDTSFGLLKIEEIDNEIVKIELNNPTSNRTFKLTEILEKAYKEINDFIKGKRKSFTFKINPSGTEFQKSVWNALLNIPYGEVKSYKDIAIAIGNPKACRAVGMANNKNPIPIVIPCHRVIGSNGKLTGYAYGLSLKEHLLNLEKTKGTK
ncbi:MULTISPECIES: methylated-DNA--[protein]-cysteine S-methyltransferase [Cetobacterium]|jgi:methylated-DNA-[protein]-cysteine S-methyltransferase|uniref:Methylated-DNA--protein-cysteine methyltransferase n=1 Tax=Candidatus Cetobacterium colombiensis TaxID=3073100 RepID=A0ABU4WD01_9FUSO|nr:methylated-DNA--[protein]-cysteine S-methyltransferase [Candidatus Cetobacterium colombiensis]MDX8336383.1 methylated-DNA--[protein]-cysteine S-methyltransferase [Candidatus Cetobacterium colombiensis]